MKVAQFQQLKGTSNRYVYGFGERGVVRLRLQAAFLRDERVLSLFG